MCPHGPTGRHHPRYICGAWRRTSGGRFLNHQKHQHYAGQCLTNHGQTFSEVSNGNRATCRIFPRRVAQLTQVGRGHGATHHSLSDNGTEKFAQFFRYVFFNPLSVLPTPNVKMEIVGNTVVDSCRFSSEASTYQVKLFLGSCAVTTFVVDKCRIITMTVFVQMDIAA